MTEKKSDSKPDGNIRESDSVYCSPIVLVKKKNGEPHICIDYKKLNSLTIRDHYPLPRIITNSINYKVALITRA